MQIIKVGKDNLQFEIVNTIDGAVEALNNGRADYFVGNVLD
jgi:ABC-type amino acid transport substrate-binding protein